MKPCCFCLITSQSGWVSQPAGYHPDLLLSARHDKITVKPNGGPKMSHHHADTVLLKKNTPNRAPPFPPSSVPAARLCVPFDILSEGLYIQTTLQLLWLINSTGFENHLEGENGNTQFWTLLVKAPPSCWGGKGGQTSNAPPGVVRLSCLSSLTVSGMSTVVKGVNATWFCFILPVCAPVCLHLRICAFAHVQWDDNSN